MIINISSVSHTRSLLKYCEKGGEIIHASKSFGNSDDIYHQMQEQEAFNTKCIKKTFHASIRIAPEDKGKLSIQDWIDISDRFAKKIGFENNIYAVYIHELGTAQEHSHIVSTRITDENLAVKNNYTKYKCMDFSREIENEYNLRKVIRKLEKFKAKEVFITKDHRTQTLQKIIISEMKSSKDLNELIINIENKHGIKTKVGKGIYFTDNHGVKKKGSEIHKNISIKGIHKFLKRNNIAKQNENTEEREL